MKRLAVYPFIILFVYLLGFQPAFAGNVEGLIAQLDDYSAERLANLSVFEAGKVKKIISGLGRSRDKRAVDSLLRILQHNENSGESADNTFLRINSSLIRNEAALALGEIGDERAVKPIADVFRRIYSENKNERDNIILAGVYNYALSLAKLHDPEGFEVLIKALSHDYLADGKDDYPTRITDLILTLGSLGDKRAALPVIQKLNDPDWQVRDAAVKSLAKLEDERAIEPIIKTLADGKLSNVLLTAYALEHISSRQRLSNTLEILKKLLKNNEDQLVRLRVTAILIKLDSATPAHFLYESLQHDEENVRYTAIYMLYELKNIEDVNAVKARLNDKSNMVRYAAVKYIGRFGGKQDIDAIKALLTDDDYTVKHEAERTINKLEKL